MINTVQLQQHFAPFLHQSICHKQEEGAGSERRLGLRGWGEVEGRSQPEAKRGEEKLARCAAGFLMQLGDSLVLVGHFLLELVAQGRRCGNVQQEAPQLCRCL